MVSEEGVSSQTAWYKTMQTSSSAAKQLFDNEKNLVKSGNGVILSENTITEATNKMSLGAKAGQVALDGLAMAGNALLTLGISAVISLAIKGLYNLANAANNAKESAENFSNSFSSMNDEFTENDNKISDLQKQYDELSKGVNSLGENVSLTTDEYDTYKKVISEISDMIPNLLARYDDEGNKIGFVQGKLKDLSAEYDNYKRKKAMDLVNGENDNGDSIKDVFKNYGYQIRHENADGTVVGNTKVFGSSNYEKITQLQAQIKYGDGNHAGFSKLTNEEIEEKTALIQKYQSEIDASVFSIQDAMIAIGQSGNEYYKLSDKQQQFFDTYIGSLSQDAIDKNGLYNETAARTFVNNFIKDIKADKNKVLEAYNDLLSFDVNDSSLNPEQIKEQVDKLLQALAKALGDEDWQDLKIRLGFEFVDDNASDYENFVDRTKNKLSKFGGEGTGKLMNFFSANGIDSSKGVNEFLDVYNATEQAKKGIYDADVAMQEWIKHSKEASGSSTPVTLSSAWEQLKASTEDATKGVADELQTLADKGELTIKTFSETSGAENYFDQLGISAETAVDYINKLSDKNSQVAQMRKNIKSMTTALGTKETDGMVNAEDFSGFDATIKGLDTWKEFTTLLGDSSSSMAECQEAANKLATEYVNSNETLANLNDANKDYYISNLTDMGITNAKAVVEAKLKDIHLQEADALQECINAQLSLNNEKINSVNGSDLLANATANEVISLCQEAQQAGNSANALVALAWKKMQASKTTITTDGDIRNLADLAGASTELGSALNYLASIKKAATHGMPSKDAEAAMKAATKRVNALINGGSHSNVEIAPYYGSSGSSGGSGGSGSGSSSKTETAFDKLSDWASKFFDWIEVRLDRLQKKIDSNISKAESKLNDKRYSSATAYYMSAVGGTYEKIYNTQRGRDKYQAQASSYLNKAVSLGAINKKLANEIRTRVADGSINISQYSSDIQTVISTYKGWIDKAKDLTTEMQTLHDSLRTYADDLKKVSDAQRDASVSFIETKETIATGGILNTSSAKNSALNYSNAVLDVKNNAYYTATKSANSNANKLAGSATSAVNKSKIKGDTKYNTTLNSIKGYIKKRVSIPESLLVTVAKKNPTLYNRLYMYNLGIENLQTAREEYATAYAANNADIYKNISEYYQNLDDATNDAMDLNGSKSTNAVTAKEKNSYLNKQASGYDTIISRDTSEINKYSSNKSAALKSMSKSARGVSYNALATKNRSVVNKFIDDARRSAKNGKVISSSTLGKLSEYYKKGYVSTSFYQSCIAYNNALESYNQAKAQKEIDEQTAITQKAELAQQKFSNISTEYDNTRHKYEQAETEINNQMSIAEERGNGASANWYNKLKIEKQNQKNNKIKERQSLIDSLNNSVKNGSIKYHSEEWYDMRSQIDDLTNSIDECTKSLAEYDNQIMQIHWDRIDEQAQKIQNLIDENDFVINELSRKDLTSDKTGGLTSEGNAVAGLHVANFKAYQENAQSYYDEIAEINEKLAKDPYNEKLIEQKEDLIKKYQDATKSAQDEKWAVLDLIEQGYTALQNKIKDLVSDYEDLLDSQKDAYDYSNNIADKTKTITNLCKQLEAVSGDVSEETRAKVQEWSVSLKDAEKDLKDTQYDKYISYTKDMLSDFQDDLNDSIQDIVDNLDNKFDELIEDMSKQWSDSNDAITSMLEKIKYAATENFNNVSADGKVTENVGDVLDSIGQFMQDAWRSYDKNADNNKQFDFKEETGSASGSSTGSGSTKKSDSSNNKTTIKPKVTAIKDSSTKAFEAKIAKFITQNATKATKTRNKYGVLNKTLYDNYGKKVMTAAKWNELAKLLGFKTYSSDKKSDFWRALHTVGIKGFKKGSDYIPYDQIANLAEEGKEFQYDISQGVLKPVGKGDMVFTAEQAKVLSEFSKNPYMYSDMYKSSMSVPTVPVNNRTDNDVNITIGDINLDNVQNPVEFANAMKDVIKNNTGNVRNMIREDTVGSLSKGYNSQKIKRW